MAITVEVLEFPRDDPESVLTRMKAIVARGDGMGWINLGPALTEEQHAALPSRSGLGAWVSGRGPVVPMGTWTPPRHGKRRRLAQLGIAHGTGRDAVSRLEEAGAGLPAGWTKKQDHAKHGIVVEVPDGAVHGDVVAWLLRVIDVLSPIVSLDDRWIAEVHVPA
jgi:hypothetical protein